jgi:hypothetical protein
LQKCHDFRAINDRAEEIKNVTKGKEDDKVYRGLNYYNQYIEKKESLIGTRVLPSLLICTLCIAVPYLH